NQMADLQRFQLAPAQAGEYESLVDQAPLPAQTIESFASLGQISQIDCPLRAPVRALPPTGKSLWPAVYCPPRFFRRGRPSSSGGSGVDSDTDGGLVSWPKYSSRGRWSIGTPKAVAAGRAIRGPSRSPSSRDSVTDGTRPPTGR